MTDNDGMEWARALEIPKRVIDRSQSWHAGWGVGIEPWLRGQDGYATDLVSVAIDDAAFAFVVGDLSPREGLLFEEFFIGCRKFRRQVIVAIALRSADVDYDSDDLTELDRVAGLFAFEESTAEHLTEAQERYDAVAGPTTLPRVDVGTGELVVDQRPPSELSLGELIRRCLGPSPSSSDLSEYELRAEADERVRALYWTMEQVRAWVWSVAGENEAR